MTPGYGLIKARQPHTADHFTMSSDVAPRLRLRSANRHQLIVPRWHIQPMKLTVKE